MSVNLVKGQKISLEKEKKLSQVFMGLGWDMAKKSGGFFKGLFGGGEDSIDLDASCIAFDDKGDVQFVVYFGDLRSKDGSIVHSGDNLTGEGDGDDEVIHVNLSKIPANVKTLVFTVSSYRGQTFDNIDNAFCRLVDETNGQELAILKISGGGSYTGLLMCKLYRHNDEWKLGAIGEPVQARTVADMIGDAKKFL